MVNVSGLCAARLIKKNEQFKAESRVAQNPCYKHTTEEMEFKHKVGDTILILNDDTSVNLTSKCKKLKKGYYEVIKIRESFSVKKEFVYELKSIKKNSKYIHIYFTKYVEENSF